MCIIIYIVTRVYYVRTCSSVSSVVEETPPGAIGGGDAGSGREHRDQIPLMGDPRFPSGSFYMYMYMHIVLKLSQHDGSLGRALAQKVIVVNLNRILSCCMQCFFFSCTMNMYMYIHVCTCTIYNVHNVHVYT